MTSQPPEPASTKKGPGNPVQWDEEAQKWYMMCGSKKVYVKYTFQGHVVSPPKGKSGR